MKIPLIGRLVEWESENTTGYLGHLETDGNTICRSPPSQEQSTGEGEPLVRQEVRSACDIDISPITTRKIHNSPILLLIDQLLVWVTGMELLNKNWY